MSKPPLSAMQEDCDLQNVWMMGGLSILTSVPIMPPCVCLLCASKGQQEVKAHNMALLLQCPLEECLFQNCYLLYDVLTFIMFLSMYGHDGSFEFPLPILANAVLPGVL